MFKFKSKICVLGTILIALIFNGCLWINFDEYDEKEKAYSGPVSDITYTITYYSEKGNIPVKKIVADNYVLKEKDLPVLSENGYIFEYWINKINGKKVTPGYVVRSNTYLKAVWSADSSEYNFVNDDESKSEKNIPKNKTEKEVNNNSSENENKLSSDSSNNGTNENENTGINENENTGTNENVNTEENKNENTGTNENENTAENKNTNKSSNENENTDENKNTNKSSNENVNTDENENKNISKNENENVSENKNLNTDSNTNENTSENNSQSSSENTNNDTNNNNNQTAQNQDTKIINIINIITNPENKQQTENTENDTQNADENEPKVKEEEPKQNKTDCVVTVNNSDITMTCSKQGNIYTFTAPEGYAYKWYLDSILQDAADNTYNLDTSNLTPGIYTVMLLAKNGTRTYSSSAEIAVSQM